MYRADGCDERLVLLRVPEALIYQGVSLSLSLSLSAHQSVDHNPCLENMLRATNPAK
jgi:hypothetical protein